MTLDLTATGGVVWALLPEILLSVCAMAVLLAGVSGGKTRGTSGDRADSLMWLALSGIIGAAVANAWLHGVNVVGDAGMIAVDPFRLYGNWILLLGAALTLLISIPYIPEQRLQAGEFYSLVLLAIAGMMVMIGTRNLIVLFLALETMSIAAYVLTGCNRRDRRSAEASLKYFILGAFSSAFLLYGIALVWGATGSVTLPEVAETIETGAGFTGLLLAGMGLIGIGFAFKVAAVPFHMWAPDVYDGAPTPSTAFMAVAVKSASVLAFVRIFLEAFWLLYDAWYPVAWWLAALTIIVGNLIALSQTSVKRMLAYSSVAHGGYLLVGLAAANQISTAAVLSYLLVYTVMNAGAFGIVMTLGGHSEDRVELDDFAGAGWSRPLLGVMFTVFLLSLAGFPGTGGFMAKIFLLQGAVASRLWTLALLLALGTVISYYYYLRVAWYMWMKPPGSAQAMEQPAAPVALRAALIGSAALVLVLGIFPGPLLDGAVAAADALGLFSADGLLGLAP